MELTATCKASTAPPSSDLDLLVELPKGTSLLTIVGLEQELSDALGVAVDLCTERELHPDLAPRILAEARPV